MKGFAESTDPTTPSPLWPLWGTQLNEPPATRLIGAWLAQNQRVGAAQSVANDALITPNGPFCTGRGLTGKSAPRPIFRQVRGRLILSRSNYCSTDLATGLCTIHVRRVPPVMVILAVVRSPALID